MLTRVTMTAADLRPRVQLDVELDDREVMLTLGDGVVAILTEGELYEISEAWRTAYEVVIEARHGVEAVV